MGILTRVCYNRHNEMTVVWRKSWNGKESCAVCFIGSKHINMRWWDCICLYFWRVLGFWSWWWRNRRWSFIVRLMTGSHFVNGSWFHIFCGMHGFQFLWSGLWWKAAMIIWNCALSCWAVQQSAWWFMLFGLMGWILGERLRRIIFVRRSCVFYGLWIHLTMCVHPFMFPVLYRCTGSFARAVVFGIIRRWNGSPGEWPGRSVCLPCWSSSIRWLM